MPRMIELIRASVVPHNILQSAAKGALSVPAPEMIEILVHLARHDRTFGEQARLTLASWNASSLRSLALDPQAPKEVLDYLIAPQNLRLPLLPALLENLAVTDATIAELAAAAPREAVEILLKSARVNLAKPLLSALSSNPNVNGVQREKIRSKLEPPTTAPPGSGPAPTAAGAEEILSATDAAEEPEAEDVLDDEIIAYLAEHSHEIAAEQHKVFHPIGGFYEDILSVPEEPPAESAASAVSVQVPAAAGAKRAVATKKAFLTAEEQRGSALQKISRLDVKGRIQLAMKGNKEERSILVRDGSKVVALAVLESPKITDGEVETFASQKNVLEAVLRGIPLKRRFMKHYGVVRNLVFNPRTPLDLSLNLIKNLLLNDLKNLSANKEVSETVKKLATKMYKQKKDLGKK